MAITVQITTTNYVVTATEVSQNITIIADSSTFTVTNQVSNFTITNVQPTITFTTDGTNGFDFATKFRGEWVYGETYLRNDCVTYQENFYVCKIAILTTLVSTIPPPDDPTNWTEVIDIRNITTASIQDLTVANMTVTNTFKLGPLYYSNTAGLYGQVLFTDGSSYANWTNLGDLVIWSLSEDLKTNGFGIKTNTSTNLKIGSYDSVRNYSYIDFKTNGIDYYATASNHSFYNTSTFPYDPLTISQSVVNFNGRELYGCSNATIGLNATIVGNLYLTGLASGTAAVDPFKVGSGGIRFTDGSIINSAGTGSFNLTQIASTATLGVIRVGNNLTINSSTGVLNATFTYTEYVLPAASVSTRGGIKVGNGLTISGPQNDILNVSTSTQFGNVSLTQDMLTNGYNIKSNSAGDSVLQLIDNTFYLTGGGEGIVKGSYIFQISKNGGELEILGNSADIRLKNIGLNRSIILEANTASIASNLTKIGRSANTSTLHVQKIYNYAGSYAPEFPAGIQFGDASVQVTAWQTSTLIQSSIVVDFDNPFDP